MKIKLILAGLVLCLSTQSQAIGDVERGALIGAGSLIILNKLFRDTDNDGSDRYREPPRRYEPVPQYNYYQYPRYREKEVIIIERHPYYREPHYYMYYR